MNDKTIAETVTRLITEQLCMDPGEVTPEARICDDLGADSLDAVELEMSLEEELNFSAPGDLLNEWDVLTVGKLIDRVEQVLVSK
jgi:acyl carrier protein